MPFLNLKLPGALSRQQTENIAQTVTKLTTDLLGKNSAVTAVVVEPIPADCWFVGGTPLNETGRTSFNLDIKITAGTNTKQQKATYINNIFSALEKALGRLDQASYIVIHEIGADSWGYEGVTQEYRFSSASSL